MSINLLKNIVRLLNNQSTLIEYQRAEINVLNQNVVSHQRAMIKLAESFLVALETPEIDIRDDLLQLISELSDGVAQLEEHVL